MNICKACGKEVKTKRKTCDIVCLRKLQSINSSGENNAMYGKTHTDSARELIGTKSKGTVGIRDSDGNRFKVSVLDEKYINGEYHVLSGDTVWSDEAKLKQSISHKGIKPHEFTKEMRAKVGEWSKNKPLEVLLKTRQTNYDRGHWVKPEDQDPYRKYFKACEFTHGFQTDNILEKNLLNEHGVFNKVTNKKGCVRDHLLSRKYGFENNIDVKIISHPANCEIVLHAENVRRRASRNDNQITLDELLIKIEEYDNK